MIFGKILQFTGKRLFHEKITTDTHYTANFSTSAMLKKVKFPSEKPIYFFSKNPILNVLRSVTKPVHSMINFLEISEKNTARKCPISHQTSDAVNWQSSVNKNIRVDWMIFLPYYKHGGTKITDRPTNLL